MAYQQDWAVVLPDNSKNNLYIGQQLMEISRQKEAARIKQQEDDAKRQENLLKLVGDIDPTKINKEDYYAPYAVERMGELQKNMLNYLSEKRNKGERPDEIALRQNINDGMAKIASDHLRAKNAEAGIKEIVKQYKGPGIDDAALLDLALEEYFKYTDPETGKKSVDPNKWRDVSPQELVKDVLEKHYDVIGNNKGVDEAIQKAFRNDKPYKMKLPPLFDRNGNIIPGSYEVSIPGSKELVYDENNNPTGEMRIKRAPVLKPDGTPIYNMDGSIKTSIDPGIEKAMFDTVPGLQLTIKNQLAEKIKEENKTRERLRNMVGPHNQSIMPVSEDEAEIMKRDLVLDFAERNSQGGEFKDRTLDDYKAMKAIQARERSLELQSERNGLFKAYLNEKKQRLAAGDNSEVDYFKGIVDQQTNTYEIETKPFKKGEWRLFKKNDPDQQAEHTPTEIFRTDNLDQRELETVVGTKDGKAAINSYEFKLKSGEKIKGLLLERNSSGEVVAVRGKDGVAKKETVNDFFNNKLFRKSAQGQVGKRGQEYVPVEDKNKPAAQQPATKIKGTKKSVFD